MQHKPKRFSKIITKPQSGFFKQKKLTKIAHDFLFCLQLVSQFKLVERAHTNHLMSGWNTKPQLTTFWPMKYVNYDKASNINFVCVWVVNIWDFEKHQMLLAYMRFSAHFHSFRIEFEEWKPTTINVWKLISNEQNKRTCQCGLITFGTTESTTWFVQIPFVNRKLRNRSKEQEETKTPYSFA